MKKNYVSITLTALFLGLATACNGSTKEEEKAETQPGDWQSYDVGTIIFVNQAPDSKGSQIYNEVIPDPTSYIQDRAREVLSTLYFSPEDQITRVDSITYTLEDKEGISAKGGGDGNISIYYSTQYLEKIHNEDPTPERIHFETRGVLLHELAHAYQLEPKGVGSYGTNKTFWALIEGMADAVRVVNGGFRGPEDRPVGGHYTDGYRYGGFFYAWLQENKDPDFIKKLNLTCLELNPWSFEEAFKLVLGPEADVEALWQEYQADITPSV